MSEATSKNEAGAVDMALTDLVRDGLMTDNGDGTFSLTDAGAARAKALIESMSGEQSK